MGLSRKASALPRHGVGVVWWPELNPLCHPREGLVNLIEAEPEAFWTPSAGQPSGFTSWLPGALGHLPQPKLLHGVGAPFGGSAMQSAEHRETLAGDIAALQPAWISDHLSFNRFTPAAKWSADNAVSTGFFLPPAQCTEGLALAVDHIKRRRTTAGVPVAFEVPVSYLPPRPGEMPDGRFAAEVAEAADCGILLDLHNILCNERNGRQTVAEFCESIPLERVWEVHLAGGESDRGFWLDAHCGLVEPALMEIVAEIVPRLPALGAIVFEIMPDSIAHTGLAAIGTLLSQLNDVWATRMSSTAPVKHGPMWIPNGGMPVAPAVWEWALGAALTGLEGPDLPPEFADWFCSAQKPLELYRHIAQENRASSLVYSAPRTITSLLTRLGEAETRQLLARFWCHATPGYTAVEEARAFLDFLSGASLAVPELAADIAGDRDSLNNIGMIS